MQMGQLNQVKQIHYVRIVCVKQQILKESEKAQIIKNNYYYR